MTGDPAQTILALLAGAKRPTGRSVLITGPWGCGKTHLWKKLVAPELKRPCIYVSAFGAESAANLKGRLLAHFALGLLGRAPLGDEAKGKVAGIWDKLIGKSGRAGAAVASSLNSVAASFLRRADIDPLELADLLAVDTVLCIDDIERVSGTFKIEDLLGVVNVLSEHKGFDVVLICNEDHIKGEAGRADTYAKYKEKAIAAELHLSGDPVATFDRIAEASVASESARARVLAAKPTILEVFKHSKTENLRLLSKVCTILDALAASGVRELSAPEVRFLTAVVIHLAVDPPKTDGFFEVNQFAVRVVAAMEGRQRREVDPESAGRAKFLETYFGDAEYEFHAGIYEAVKKGRIDPTKFERVAPPELTGVSKTLSTVTNAEWRFWKDAQVGALFDSLVAHLQSSDAQSAQELLDCLAYARLLGSILERPVPAAVTDAATASLQVFADADDQTLGPHWEMHMVELLPDVKEEVDVFRRATKQRMQRRLEEALSDAFKNHEIEAVVRLLSTNDPAPIQALFELVGLKVVMDLRRDHAKMFAVVIQCIRKKGAMWSGVWPEVVAHLAKLSEQLNAIADDPKEDRMVRRLARGLLK